MVKHGLSHSLLGALVLVFNDELKIAANQIRDQLPELIQAMLVWLTQSSGDDSRSVIVLLALLCFSWGVLFHYIISLEKDANV